MNAATQSESKALSLPERASVALGSPAHEVKLRELVLASAAILSVTNKAGRDECHTAYMTLKNTRVNINHTVDEVTEDAKAFTKAVKAEATRLLGIMLAEENRLQGLRDGWDESEEARKDALIAAERARVERIEAKIELLARLPVLHAQSDAAMLADAITEFDGWLPPPGDYEEFTDKAADTIMASLETLRDMLTARQQQEQAAAAAEQARLAELARIEAEKVELAAQRAENERIAAEQKAEAKRLSDAAAAQQAAAAARQKEINDAAWAAQAEQQAAFDKQAAEIAEAGRKLAEQQAAADARDAAALAATKAAEAAELAKQQDAARRESDHGPALSMNAEFDAARAATRERLAATCSQYVEHVTDQHSANAPVDAADDVDVLDPTNNEIVSMGEECGLGLAAWRERLEHFVVWARAELAAGGE